MGESIRWGIVGAGMMGREHVANLQLTPDSVIVALVDPAPDQIAATQAMLAAPATVYATPAELAASGTVDAVLVASPNFTHFDVLGPVMDARLDILCEKPLATTFDDARAVARAAAGYDRVFWTGMEYRYMPPVAAFIAQVHRARIGPLRMLSIREHRFPFLVKVGDWNRFNRKTGGTMVEKCCHFFDLMRTIVQSEPVRVFCSGGGNVNHRGERYDGAVPDIIDNSYTVVDFANGVRAMLDLCMFADGAENQEEIVAVGDLARLDVLIPSGNIVFSPRVGFMNPKTVTCEHVPVDDDVLAAGQHHGATFYQHRAFAAAVRGDGPVEVTADDGLRAVAIGLAAETSAREHRIVEMTEFGL